MKPIESDVSDTKPVLEIRTRAYCYGIHRVPAIFKIGDGALTVRPVWDRFPCGKHVVENVGKDVELFVPRFRYFGTVPQLLIRGKDTFSLVQIKHSLVESVTRQIEDAGFSLTTTQTPAFALINSILLAGLLRHKGIVAGDREKPFLEKM